MPGNPITPPSQGGPYTFAILCDPSGTVVTLLATEILLVPSLSRSAYNSGNINVSQFAELAIDFNMTARTGAGNVIFTVSRVGSDGVSYPIATATLSGTVPQQASLSIGNGMSTAAAFGDNINIVMSFSGSVTAATFSASIIGKS
jgi:hypothetical protein